MAKPRSLTERMQKLRMMWIAFTAAIVIYGIILVARTRPPSAPADIDSFRSILVPIGLLLAGVSIWWRLRATGETLFMPVATPRGDESFATLRTNCIICWVLSQSVAILGLFLGFLSQDLSAFLPFGVGGLALMVVHRPSAWPQWSSAYCTSGRTTEKPPSLGGRMNSLALVPLESLRLRETTGRQRILELTEFVGWETFGSYADEIACIVAGEIMKRVDGPDARAWEMRVDDGCVWIVYDDFPNSVWIEVRDSDASLERLHERLRTWRGEHAGIMPPAITVRRCGAIAGRGVGVEPEVSLPAEFVGQRFLVQILLPNGGQRTAVATVAVLTRDDVRMIVGYVLHGSDTVPVGTQVIAVQVLPVPSDPTEC